MKPSGKNSCCPESDFGSPRLKSSRVAPSEVERFVRKEIDGETLERDQTQQHDGKEEHRHRHWTFGRAARERHPPSLLRTGDRTAHLFFQIHERDREAVLCVNQSSFGSISLIDDRLQIDERNSAHAKFFSCKLNPPATQFR